MQNHFLKTRIETCGFRVKGNSISEIDDVDYINCIAGDAKGNIWFGLNYGGGLGYFNQQTDSYSHYNDNSELAEKNVVGILVDNNNILWLSTDKGLVRFNPDKNSFQTFTSSDGIAANEFNNNAFFKDSKGMLYFGGYNGITRFLPEQIETNTRKAPLVFTGLKLFNARVEINDEKKILKKNITLTNEIIFKYDQSVFTIEFALLNFIKSNKNRYKYKLEGFDKDWLETTATSVTYNNLAPGSYQFILSGANNDGIWSDPQTMDIRVLPPFWLTWWAYSIYSLAALMFVFFVYRFFFLRALLLKEEELHQVKLNFFTNVSHEILTHLTLIVAPVENLLENNQSGNPNKEKLILIKNNATQLFRLVKELMDFRKAETNHLQLNIERHNLIAFLDEIFTSFLDLAKAKNIKLSFIHERDDIFVYFDPEQVEKVFYNLLTNALKFTPEGGHIELLVVQNNNKVKISVCDNGRGIHPQYIDKIFTNFFQVSDYGRQNTGYGIGLALSKNIIELHKGSITVQSEPASNKNEGRTCFTVILQQGNKHLVNGSNKDGLKNVMKNSSEIAAVPSVKEAVETFSILIAEDNPDMLQLLKDTFEKQYAVQVCTNGLDAWERSISEIPDLVVSDVMMPEMDGFELCKRLKTDKRTSHIPVILLTAKTTQEDQIAGLETGADIYITKPYSPKILELNIRNLLSFREKLRKRFGQLLVSAPKKENETITSDNFINSVDKEFYDKVVELINEHLDDPEFGVSMLSRKVAMSAPILYKKLKALTNMSVNDFVKSIRMKKAAELLMKKDLTVSEIAFMVGYNDRKYFSQEFKKQFGKTPSVFAD
jgi:signal transduction histidine kinase/DNA-binding response OmpR family regulator